MYQYHNRNKKEKSHPALSQMYGVDEKAILKTFDISSHLERPHIKKQIKTASELEKINIAILERIYIGIFASNPKMSYVRVSQKRLAERCGCVVRTIRKAVAALRKVGLLWVMHNYNQTKEGSRRGVSSMILLGIRDAVIKKYKKINRKSQQARNASQILLSNSLRVLNGVSIDYETGEILKANHNYMPDYQKRPSS